MVEPVSVGVAIAGAFHLSKLGSKLLERVFTPLADELGVMAAGPLHHANVRRGRVIEKAAEHLQSAGVEPGPVSLKVLLPIIERSGYEEDDDLGERWAALLANAANPERTHTVLPIFPHILSMLTSDDARLLETMPLARMKKLLPAQLLGQVANT